MPIFHIEYVYNGIGIAEIEADTEDIARSMFHNDIGIYTNDDEEDHEVLSITQK